MRTKYIPLFGMILVMLVVAAAIGPGALFGDGRATVEAGAPGEDPAPAVEEAVFGEQAVAVDANCRYGAATRNNSDQYLWLDDIGAGWWLDFQVNYANPAPNGAEYAHVVWVEQAKSAGGDYLNGYEMIPRIEDNSLGYLVLRRPGRMWIIGNEVDRGPNSNGSPGQGDTMPQMYARIYHDVYHYIKSWDPTALVTPSALVEFTPGRAKYLDIVWDTYLSLYGEPMPVDLWNMHLYILPEVTPDGTPNDIATVALGTSPALGIKESDGDPDQCSDPLVYCMAEHDDITVFAEQVVRMRQWMKDHGYQNYPLIITEYSLLYKYEKFSNTPGDCEWKDENNECFTPERVRDFAVNTFNYLENTTDPDLGYPYDNNRLVQQWLWYSMFQTTDFATSNLAVNGTGPLSLTLAGDAFSAAAKNGNASVNLLAIEANGQQGRSTGGVTTVNLSVLMRNNGNSRVNEPIAVTFYRDAGLNNEIGQATVPAPDADFVGMTGCAVRSLNVPVQASWQEDLSPGDYPFWAKVDSSDSIGEDSEGDNVASGTFKIVPVGIFIPLVTG